MERQGRLYGSLRPALPLLASQEPENRPKCFVVMEIDAGATDGSRDAESAFGGGAEYWALQHPFEGA